MRWRRTGLWAHPDFLRLWIGQTISLCGTEITRLALPLTAVVFLQATPVQMGLLNAVQFAPFLLVGLLAGTWVDRWRRGPVLLWTTIGQAVVLGSIPAAALFAQVGLGHVYTVGFMTGVFTVFFDVAYQAVLPTLIGRERLVEGNSKLTTSRALTQMAGPGLGGWLVYLVTAPLAITADVGSFLVAALCFARLQEVEPPDHSAAPRQRLWTEMAEGVRTVLGHALLRPIAASIATSSLFSRMILALYVLYVTRHLGLSPMLVGGIWSLGSLGALGGSLLARRLARRYGVGPTLIGAMLLGHGGTLLIPLMTAPLSVVVPLLAVAHGLMSFGEATYNITQVSLRQALIPPRLQGRMHATMRCIGWSTLPLGALIGGLLGEMLGVRPALAVAATCGLTAVVWLVCSPVRRLSLLPEPIP
jgi:MFS family permease